MFNQKVDQNVYYSSTKTYLCEGLFISFDPHKVNVDKS